MPAGKASRVRHRGRGVTSNPFAKGVPAAARGTQATGWGSPGGQTRFYSQGAAHRCCEARYTPVLLSWTCCVLFWGDDCVWTHAAGNISPYKNIHPFEKAEDHISFKPYLNQIVKTWNISGQIRFIWNKEKYSNFGDIKLKVQWSCSWASSGAWENGV